MKRILCTLLITLAIITTTKAADGDVIEIIYSNTSASVTIPESLTSIVTYTVSGAHVNVVSSTTTEEYIYKLSGTSTDGSFTFTGAYKLTLELAGVVLTSKVGAAISINCGKRCAVVLDEGTYNWLADCNGGAQKGAFYFDGHPEFEGPGTLEVLGNTKHAIAAKEYCQIKKTTGTINILGAISDGIHCGKGKVFNEHNFFQISGGVITIENVGSDAIDSDDYGRMNIKGGVINVTINTDGGTGLKCDSIFNMTGGTLNITVNGKDAEAIRANYQALLYGGEINVNISGDGSKGIKSNCKAAGSTGPVFGGGYLTVDSTNCNFYIHANDLTDSTTGDVTKARAISADQDLIHNYGDIEIFAYGTLSNQFHSDSLVVRNGGTLTIHQAPWKFYYADFEYDMTAYVDLQIDGIAVDDINNYAIGAFIGDECVGIAIENYLRIYSNSTTADEITFKAFDLTSEQPITVLSISKEVVFENGSIVSTDSDPIILNGRSFLRGDVNGDGSVTIADVTALVNIILGSGTDTYNAADVNEDSTISIADVTALVNLILGK